MRGRDLAYTDSHDDVIAVVINQAAARRYWGARDPIGTFGHLARPDGPRIRVIGLVADSLNDGLDKPAVPEVYMLHSAAPVTRIHFVVRSDRTVASLLPEIRRTVQRIDPTQPVYRVATMTEIIHSSLSLQRVGSFMTSFFALAAAMMALVAIYGVVSYAVRQRTVEFGTRMALGAVTRNLVGLVLGGGVRLTAVGTALGMAMATAAPVLLLGELSTLEVTWIPFATSTATIAGVAVAGCLLRSGDLLFMFTDGVSEALNASDEEFGEERLKDLLTSVYHLPAEALASRVTDALKDWATGAVQSDDLTFVAMKVR